GAAGRRDGTRLELRRGRDEGGLGRGLGLGARGDVQVADALVGRRLLDLLGQLQHLFLGLVLGRRGLVHHGRRYLLGLGRGHRLGRRFRGQFRGRFRGRRLGLGFRGGGGLAGRRVVLGNDAADGGEDLLHGRFLGGLFGHARG